MIRLAKSPEPEILANNSIGWRDALLAVINFGGTPTKVQKNRYNHPDIKTQLVNETHGKCAYCEGKIRHIDDADIEHIVPKSSHPELSFDWENLSLACTVCNRNKGDHFESPPHPQSLINPYQDDPSDHFVFQRDFLTPAPGSERGVFTEDKIDLNRAELRERRGEKIQALHEFISAYVNADDNHKPTVARQITRHCLGDDREYSAFLTSYVSEMIRRGLLPEDILD